MTPVDALRRALTVSDAPHDILVALGELGYGIVPRKAPHEPPCACPRHPGCVRKRRPHRRQCSLCIDQCGPFG